MVRQRYRRKQPSKGRTTVQIKIDDSEAQRDFDEGFYEEDFAAFEELGQAEVERRLTAGEPPFHENNRQRESAAVWLRKKGI